MSETMRWAFIGDLQIPYEDKRAVALWFQVMKKWRPEAIDFVGDIDDQLEYSTFSDGTTDEFFSQWKKQKVEERESPIGLIKANADGAKQFYASVRQANKRADIHCSLGNHDIRIFNYMNKKAPEHLEEINPENLWGLDSNSITWRMYKEKPFERFAGIHVHHGDTTSSTGLGVRADIENYDISLVRGHDHRGGVVFKSYPLSGRTLRGMGTGHMCDPHGYGLQYTVNPSWELGFGLAHVYGEEAQLDFIRITSDYKCVVDGRLFSG